MKKTIYYWSPCLNEVGTVISTKNSALSVAKYRKNEFNVKLINACGEWEEHKNDFIKNGIDVIDLSYIKYFKFLPKTGFFSSRLSYIIIFLISFLPLLFLLKKKKPEFIILHLITSLPLFLLFIFNFKTKFILRISGYPKLNLLRKKFWKIISNKLYKITCPTKELMKKLNLMKIFPKEKIFFLQDAIINLDKFYPLKKINFEDHDIINKKIILAAGRLTLQKNFSYLINEFSKFLKVNDEYVLVILGKGEEKNNLIKLIKKNNLSNKVYLLGNVKNVYDYMRSSNVFVLSSLWEELGFVIAEAALNNLFIISSDCPNGPKEFLNDGLNGILYSNNKENSLLNALVTFVNLKNSKVKIINAKKKCRQYTKFNHNKSLIKIILNEDQI